MIKVADLTRKGFVNGDISTLMVKNRTTLGRMLLYLKIKDTHLELLFK